MYNQKGNQKQTGQRHHNFSTYCGGEEVGPFHIKRKEDLKIQRKGKSRCLKTCIKNRII